LRANSTRSPRLRGGTLRLYQALAFDDALARVVERTGSEVGFENGWRGLLELQEEWRAVTGLEQRDETTGADAADADDLAGHIDQGEPVEEQAVVQGKTLTVTIQALRDCTPPGAGDLVIDAYDQRWVRDDSATALDDLRQLLERKHAVASRSLDQNRFLPLPMALAVRPDAFQRPLRLEAVIMQVEWIACRRLGDGLAVVAHR
jgi:hypothetical protein